MILALDLEGTLITGVGDYDFTPRPGLRDFLERAARRYEVVVFTSVWEFVARRVVEQLARDGHAPEWFARVRIFNPPYDEEERPGKKNLRAVGPAGAVILVDDDPGFVLEDQVEEWIRIEPWWGKPGQEGDWELERVRIEIEERWTAQLAKRQAKIEREYAPMLKNLSKW